MRFAATIVIACLSFVWGVQTVRLHIFPYRLLTAGRDAPETIYNTKVNLFKSYPRDVDVVFVGDSIIEGGNWQDMFPDFVIANRGISGDTTAGVLDRLDGVLNTNPEKVFILVGINDLLNGVSPEDAFSNYQKIIEQIPGAYVLSVSYCYRRGCDNDKVDSLNALLATLPNYIKIPQPTLYDGLHPNAEGYKLLSDTLDL